MFKKPQHEHRSTGIASGLEYREGYAVGGRVGFSRGGGPLLLRGPTTPLDIKIASMGAGKSPAPFMNLRSPTVLRGEPKTGFTTPDPRITAAGSGNLPVPYNPPLIARANIPPITYKTNLPIPYGGGINPSAFNYNPAAGKFAAGALGITLGGAGLADLMSPDAILFPPSPEDDSSLSAEAKLLNAEREADIFQKRQEKMEKERKERTEQKDTKDTGTDTATDKKDKVEQAIKAINSVDALTKTRYEELDAELQSLREKQKEERRTVSLLNILSAANDPNLKRGQSRIGAGVGQLTEEAKGEVAIKQAQDESDIARKYERAEKQIQREADREDYRLKKQIDVEFGQEGAQVQYMNFLLKQMGVKPETEAASDFIKEYIFGKKGQRATLAAKILESATGFNVLPGSFRTLYGIPAKKDENGDDLPIDQDDVQAAMEYLDNEILSFDVGSDKEDFTSITERVDQRDGGRIGFANGGDVNQKVSDSKIAPIVMGYDQLKAFLPDFISDRIVKLISSNPTAFREFAEIETNKDVDDFNEKYDVRLVLPEREKMEEERVNVASNVMSNVTVPSAVAASPMTTPTQTSTGQLSPTETALLSPTEQAIKMRS